MRRSIFLLTTVIAFLNSFANSSSAQTHSINNIQLERKTDSLFSQFNNSTSPGCAVTVIENGEVIFKKAYGMANIEHQVPFTHQSVVTLPYSEAREFISIAAVLMEKDGLLSGLTDNFVRARTRPGPAQPNTITLHTI